MSKLIVPGAQQIILPGQAKTEFALTNERVMNAITEATKMFSVMLSGITGTRVDVIITAAIVERGQATTHATCPPPHTIHALEETLKHLKGQLKPVYSKGGASSDGDLAPAHMKKADPEK